MHLPAEWAKQSALLICWPHANTDWAPRLQAIEEEYLTLLEVTAAFQPVIVIVPNTEIARRIGQRVKARARHPCYLVIADYDDTWIRDFGPMALTDADQYRFLDYDFDGWGGRYAAKNSRALSQQLAACGLLDPSRLKQLDFVSEAGNLDSDGSTSLLSSWPCYHQRHPTSSRAQIEKRLSGDLGLNRILWLQHGTLEGDDTDGHVDNLARFASERAIVYQGCQDTGDRHFLPLQALSRDLAELKTMHGTPYQLFELPLPPPIIDQGQRLPASYANFVIINGAVLVPEFGASTDSQARSVIASAFPQHSCIGLPCRQMVWQRGGLHCATLQMPAQWSIPVANLQLL